MNWKFLVGASILTCGLLWKYGAPPLALLLGVALAGYFTWRKQRA